jgi:hypothetical protein
MFLRSDVGVLLVRAGQPAIPSHIGRENGR